MAKTRVEFNDATTKLLTELAAKLNSSRVEVLKRAVAVYDFVERETSDGNELVIRRQDGEVSIVSRLQGASAGDDSSREELRARSEELTRRAEDLEMIAQKLSHEASEKGRELIDEAKKQWDAPGVEELEQE